MYVAAICAVCANRLDPKGRSLPPFVRGELENSGLVHVKCGLEHESFVIYDARRYELLMRSGAMALLDGYSNESITSFATALERAHEFYVRVSCRSRNVDAIQFERTWRAMEVQTERQLGAFQVA